MLALFPSRAHLCPSPAQASLTDRPDSASSAKALGGETKAPCAQAGGPGEGVGLLEQGFSPGYPISVCSGLEPTHISANPAHLFPIPC